MKNKCTLIIDGNWLLMRNAGAFGITNFSADLPDDAKERSAYLFKDMMARTVVSTINLFNEAIDNVIFVTDGGSWRKSVVKPDSREQDYKGTRTKVETIDWNYFFNIYSSFCEGLKKFMTVSHYSKIEGDDWIWYWSNRLNNEGTNCIIWSTDNDLKQLIKLRNNSFTAVYNKKDGLNFPEELDDTCEDDIEFFLNQDKDNSLTLTLKRIVPNYKFIKPKDIVIGKILKGDVSDNIMSIIRIKKGNKFYNVSNKEIDRLKEKYNYDTVKDFVNNRDQIISFILEDKKYVGHNLDLDTIKNEFDYNTKLVWLDESQIPSNLVEVMKGSDYKPCELDYIKDNYKQLVGEDDQVKKVFEDLFL